MSVSRSGTLVERAEAGEADGAVGGHTALRCCDADRARALRDRDGVEVERAHAALRALASPVRLRLVGALAEVGELCVCDAAWICDASDALTSHHLKALVRAGLVARRRDGRLAMFRLTPRGEHAARLVGELAG